MFTATLAPWQWVALAMRFDVFGTLIEVCRRDTAWQVFYVGSEGKKRLAQDIVVPASVPEEQLEDYLADIRHEYASAEHNEVKRLD